LKKNLLTYNTKAFAKVNLHLEVLNKRSDLFHNIFSFNASLDLYDRISIKRLKLLSNPENLVIKIQSLKGKFSGIIRSIAIEDNLIAKAAKAFFRHIGKSAEIIFSIEKNIPAGAGLGGGSSDAAAVLRLLNDYFRRIGEEISETELNSLGVSIGADVPYCLTGGYAFCEGIGDRIEPIDGKLNYSVLLVYPDIEINTGNAYNLLKRGDQQKITDSEIRVKKELFRKGLLNGSLKNFRNILYNDFEEPVFISNPLLKNLKDRMMEFEPDYTAMTGSGSCIYGLFSDNRKLKKAGNAIKKSAKVIVTGFI
jgi:4-diphosphocytidyl-2-C-methyl-D-erythritol kinase